jgi:hypothetical protein
MARYVSAMALVASLQLAGTTSAKVDCDPAKPYWISAEDGGWTVCAGSFTGETSSKLAHDLVLEIRSRYGLPAFVFNRGSEMRRQQQDELQKRRQQQKEYLERMGLKPDLPLRLPSVRIEEQYAVLIGGYKDFDSASKDLARIKKLEPPKSVPKDTLTYDVVPAPGASKKPEGQRAVVNPFAHSFVARNPSIQVQKEAPNKPDPFWKELNAWETYSLLKCGKPWTLAIKEFSGQTMIQPQSAPTKFLNLLTGARAGEQLNASALNAHNMAEALHKLGFEAYVLHTRSNSIVTIGGFDSASDPRIQQVERALDHNLKFTYENTHSSDPNMGLFARPMPMEVPRF